MEEEREGWTWMEALKTYGGSVNGDKAYSVIEHSLDSSKKLSSREELQTPVLGWGCPTLLLSSFQVVYYTLER
jgi:hypothetical protein